MVCLRRLDDFLLSQELNVQVKKVNISPGYCSDHALVSLELKANDIKRGKRLWKFNNSLLRDKEYAKLVKDTILSLLLIFMKGFQTWDSIFSLIKDWFRQ